MQASRYDLEALGPHRPAPRPATLVEPGGSMRPRTARTNPGKCMKATPDSSSRGPVERTRVREVGGYGLGHRRWMSPRNTAPVPFYMDDVAGTGSKRLAAEGSVPGRQAKRGPSPIRSASGAEASSVALHEGAPKQQPPKVEVMPIDMFSKAAAWDEVVHIMGAWRTVDVRTIEKTIYTGPQHSQTQGLGPWHAGPYRAPDTCQTLGPPRAQIRPPPGPCLRAAVAPRRMAGAPLRPRGPPRHHEHQQQRRRQPHDDAADDRSLALRSAADHDSEVERRDRPGVAFGSSGKSCASRSLFEDTSWADLVEVSLRADRRGTEKGL